jgi:hypothetical protein
MKLAVIPPVAVLNDIQYREVHLLLPQLIDRYLPYENFYMYMPKKKDLKVHSTCDKFYILDNGAAEGEKWTLQELYEIADEYGYVDEIVVPDVMGDGKASLDIVQTAKLRTGKRHMYVAHGRTMGSVCKNIASAIRVPGVTTIGLPRCLFDTVINNPHGERLRIELARVTRHLATRLGLSIEVHLLGAHPLWYQELQQAASETAIRSMDTSLPYVIASHGYMMSGQTPQGLKRKEGYFDWEPSDEEASKIWFNVQLMDRWVKEGNDRLASAEASSR